MNQPHLSKIIRELERDLGCPIFNRTSRGMTPSPMGEEFLRHAKSILVQMDQIEALCSPADRESLTLSVSVPRATYLSNTFSAFVKELPTEGPMNLRYQETNARQTIRAVADKSCNLGIIRVRSITESYEKKMIAEENLAFEDLWEFSCQVLMSQAHPLAHQKNLNYLMLQGYTEIVHGDDNAPTFSYDSGDGAAPGSRTISIYERGIQFELLQKCPGTYMWASPIPFPFLRSTDLVQRPCSIPGNQYKDVLIYRNGTQFSKTETSFLQVVRRTISQLS